MPQMIIFLDEEINKKINLISEFYNISKHEAITRCIMEYKFKGGQNVRKKETRARS